MLAQNDLQLADFFCDAYEVIGGVGEEDVVNDVLVEPVAFGRTLDVSFGCGPLHLVIGAFCGVEVDFAFTGALGDEFAEMKCASCGGGCCGRRA